MLDVVCPRDFSVCSEERVKFRSQGRILTFDEEEEAVAVFAEDADGLLHHLSETRLPRCVIQPLRIELHVTVLKQTCRQSNQHTSKTQFKTGSLQMEYTVSDANVVEIATHQ